MVDLDRCVEVFGDLAGPWVWRLVESFADVNRDICLSAPPEDLLERAQEACFWTDIASVKSVPADGRPDGRGGVAMSRYGLFIGNAERIISAPVVLRLEHHDAAPTANVAKNFMEWPGSGDAVSMELQSKIEQFLRELGLPMSPTPQRGLGGMLVHELGTILALGIIAILEGEDYSFAPLLQMWRDGTIPCIIDDENTLYVICDMEWKTVSP